MVHLNTIATISMLSAACVMHSVSGHGKLLLPEAVVEKNTVGDGAMYDFVGEIDGSVAYPRAKTDHQWGGDPQLNQKEFAKVYAANGFTSLRDFLDQNDKRKILRFPGKTKPVCGYSDTNSTPVALPANGELWWGHKINNWGFQPTHYGPCEVWCDDNLAFSNSDCLATYGAKFPAKFTIEVNKCQGSKTLRMLWLAVHFTKWQYWDNCVPLKTPNTQPPTPAPTAAPSATPAYTAPGQYTVAPVQTSATPAYTAPGQYTVAPVQTSAAPVTAAPGYTTPVQTSAAPATAAPGYTTPVQTSAAPTTVAPGYTAPVQTTSAPGYATPVSISPMTAALTTIASTVTPGHAKTPCPYEEQRKRFRQSEQNGSYKSGGVIATPVPTTKAAQTNAPYY